MKLYLESGYVNMDILIRHPAPFIFVYGGRGTGKTYGSLEQAVQNNIKFIYTRRLAKQMKMAARPDLQPFNQINKNDGLDIHPYKDNEDLYFFADEEINDKGRPVPGPYHYGYMSNLNTFSNVRGLSAEDIRLWIHDEFIPEPGEHTIQEEDVKLFNAYETINRNRELDGKPPLKLICLANANDLANPLFIGLGLVRQAEKLRTTGKEYIYLENRGMLLVDLYKSEISERKADTALYRLTAGTGFYDMAIKNVFSGEERGRIGHRPIKEYRPIVGVGEICVYRHKSKREYYISTLCSGGYPVFGSGSKDLQRFKMAYRYLWGEYMRRNLIFEEYLCEVLFCKYFK